MPSATQATEVLILSAYFYLGIMNLLALISCLRGELPSDLPDVEVAGISLDSRQVKPGDIFVALPGGTTDGHRFIPDAIRRGAVAVVGVMPLGSLAVPYIQVEDSRKALACLAAAFYGLPARKMTVIGVTGTDGKTTTVNLIFQILKAAGLSAGMISTVNAVIGNQVLDTGFHVTTPEAPDVQNYLAQMVAQGLSHVVLEATSHGLAQHRVTGCEFDMAVVTNITHEHLDYHGSYNAYRAAKASLFTSLEETAAKPFSPPRGAVFNRDDQSFGYLSSLRLSYPRLSYGMDPEADVRASQVQHLKDGLRFLASGRTVQGKEFFLPVTSHLLGDFNVSNCLAAIAVTVGLMDLEPEAVRHGIASLPGVPGRMERIDLGQDFLAFVDFAHTPNALRCALQTSRRIMAGEDKSGRLIAVFGSAGLRDRAKRRMMAEVSAELSDITILTAEDPRTESLAAILEEMADGARARRGVEGRSFWRIPDRREAIRFAVQMAKPGDLLIVCGKGHEQSMCFGVVEYPWDDRIALRAALAERLNLPGPAMPYLPDPNSI